MMLIRSIEKFLRQHDMPAASFGRLATRDARFVFDLRMGRIPRPETQSRIERFMNSYAADTTGEG